MFLTKTNSNPVELICVSEPPWKSQPCYLRPRELGAYVCLWTTHGWDPDILQGAFHGAASRSALGKTDLFKCMGFLCLFLFSHDHLRSQLLHRQRWLLRPQVPKLLLCLLRAEEVASSPSSPWLTILHPPEPAPQELLCQKIIKVFAPEDVIV